MNNEFWRGKTILITGTSSGIGKALVDLLSGTECTIFSVARSVAAGSHPHIIPLQYDLSKEQDVRKLGKEIAKHTDRLDILVNNAGITAHGRFDETDISVFRKVFDLNFFGSIYVTQIMLPMLKKAKGTVMTVSTVSGFYGIPARAAYSASKAALHAVFESFTVEMKDEGVRSIIICPPYTRTGLRTSGLDASGQRLDEGQHSGKILLPEDVARHMIYLLESGKTGIRAMDLSGHFVRWMRTLWPSFLNRILYKKLYKDFH